MLGLRLAELDMRNRECLSSLLCSMRTRLLSRLCVQTRSLLLLCVLNVLERIPGHRITLLTIGLQHVSAIALLASVPRLNHTSNNHSEVSMLYIQDHIMFN
jgi:hypothetical protein